MCPQSRSAMRIQGKVNVGSTPGWLRLRTQDGHEYSCRAVVAATGLSVPYVPSKLKGIELTEGYDGGGLEMLEKSGGLSMRDE